jgi:surface carbohydrate biosynthesis protein
MKPSRQSLRVDYMMTFGTDVGAEYARYIQGTAVAIGSLRCNLVPKRQSQSPDTIAFISQYRNVKGLAIGTRFCTFREFFEQVDQLVLLFLLNYVAKHHKQFFIVPCSIGLQCNNLPNEREYYRKLLGQSCVFSEWTWGGSSYEATDSADVVLGIDSTLVYESAARGNKTAIFSIRSQMLGIPGLGFGWPATYPDEGPFWTNRPDPAAFERILDHLFEITQDQWDAELKQQNFSGIMAYNQGNTILKSVLEKELDNRSSRTRQPNSAGHAQIEGRLPGENHLGV